MLLLFKFVWKSFHSVASERVPLFYMLQCEEYERLWVDTKLLMANHLQKVRGGGNGWTHNLGRVAGRGCEWGGMSWQFRWGAEKISLTFTKTFAFLNFLVRSIQVWRKFLMGHFFPKRKMMFHVFVVGHTQILYLSPFFSFSHTFESLDYSYPKSFMGLVNTSTIKKEVEITLCNPHLAWNFENFLLLKVVSWKVKK